MLGSLLALDLFNPLLNVIIVDILELVVLNVELRFKYFLGMRFHDGNDNEFLECSTFYVQK